MGTLQAELKKITSLDSLKFDDDPQDSPAPTVVADEGRKPQRKVIWEWLHAHPGATNGQIARATGMAGKFVATALNHFHHRGAVSREMVDGVYLFTTATDTYPAMSNAERAQVMLAARKHLGKNRGKAKVVKQERAKPTAPPPLPVLNSIDDIINHLSVVQARELYDKLRKIFGG